MQNDTLTIIHNRRAVRKYKPMQISGEALQAIMEAALYAPSARNTQAWHFSVIQNPELLAKMRESMKTGMRASGEEFLINRANDPTFVPYFGAPTVIIVSAPIDDRSGHRFSDEL